MKIPEAIWKDPRLDIWDKLIVGVILNDGSDKTPGDIAQELKTTKKMVTQRINRLRKEGILTVQTNGHKVHMEVCYGS